MIVVRETEGHIVELAMRCGTPTIMRKQYMKERQTPDWPDRRSVAGGSATMAHPRMILA